MDDLVERLRRSGWVSQNTNAENNAPWEAADRIEKLEAENAELQHQIEIRDAAAVSRANLSDNRGVRP